MGTDEEITVTQIDKKPPPDTSWVKSEAVDRREVTPEETGNADDSQDDG